VSSEIVVRLLQGDTSRTVLPGFCDHCNAFMFMSKKAVRTIMNSFPHSCMTSTAPLNSMAINLKRSFEKLLYSSTCALLRRAVVQFVGVRFDDCFCIFECNLVNEGPFGDASDSISCAEIEHTDYGRKDIICTAVMRIMLFLVQTCFSRVLFPSNLD
jgi:hypothetical protein